MGDMERRLVEQMNEHNQKETEQFMRLREELSTREILEKWRYLIIGGFPSLWDLHLQRF